MNDAISPSAIRRSIALAKRLTGRMRRTQLPVDVFDLAERLGVASVEPREMQSDGYVGRRSDGRVVIRYRECNSAERNRFTIAHEIGHLLISEVTRIDIMIRKDRSGSNAEEMLANRIAAELLMPELVLREEVLAREPSWNAIAELRHLFHVSTSALLRRIVELRGIRAIYLRVIDRDPDGFALRWMSSQTQSLRFVGSLRKQITTAIDKYCSGKSAAIKVDGPNGIHHIRCVGREMSNFGRNELWLVGWCAARA